MLCGRFAFSPVKIADGTKDGSCLGPPLVLPGYQRQGIEKALINEGLSLLKDLGAQGCALAWVPNDYKRFDSKNYPQLPREGVPQEVFVVLPFAKKIPKGIVVFHDGCKANGQQVSPPDG